MSETTTVVETTSNTTDTITLDNQVGMTTFSPWPSVDINVKAKLSLDGKCIFCDKEINYPTIVGFNHKDKTVGPVCIQCKKKLKLKNQVAEAL